MIWIFVFSLPFYQHRKSPQIKKHGGSFFTFSNSFYECVRMMSMILSYYDDLWTDAVVFYNPFASTLNVDYNFCLSPLNKEECVISKAAFVGAADALKFYTSERFVHNSDSVSRFSGITRFLGTVWTFLFAFSATLPDIATNLSGITRGLRY